MKSMYLLWAFILASVVCCGVSVAAEQKEVAKPPHLFNAIVLDAETKAALSMARVEVEELELRLRTGSDGRFQIRLFQPNKRYTLRISYLGYKSHESVVTLAGDKEVTFMLHPSSYALEGVQVQGRRSTKQTGHTKISKTALDYLQPTGLQDALLLTPGGLVRNPGLRGVQQIQMRETRNSVNSALGTAIVLDDAPISNDANLQGMGNHNQALSEKSTMNRGIDLREISIDHIESIEVIQGIPSVRYGNLTSGVVVLNTKVGRSPWEIRAQADPYTKLFSLGKGYNLNREHNFYGGVDYAHSLGNIVSPISGYRRITALLKHSYSGRGEWKPNTSLSFAYTGTLDQKKFDPEIMTSREIYRNTYDRFALNGRFSLRPQTNLIEQIEGTLSLSYTHDLVDQERYISPQSTLVQPILKETGEGEGAYLPPTYFSVFKTDGRPFELFSQVRSIHRFMRDRWSGTLMLGAELRVEKNFGLGAVYDPLLPPNPGSSLSSRPIAYRDIPARVPLALFAEQTLRHYFGNGWKGEVRAGLRATQELALRNTDRYLSERFLIEPRAQISVTAPEIKIAGSSFRSSIFGGYGRHLKMPTLGYLYPERAYMDFVEANYYHKKPENRLLWVRTYVVDRVNRSLRPNREDKFELGVNMTWKEAELSINLFRHLTTAGFENRTQLAYTPYNRYTYDGVVGEGKPTLDLFNKERIDMTSGYSTPDNSVKVLKRGVEYLLRFPRIESLKTNITVQGSWYKTLYGNSLPTAYRPSEIFNGRSYPYVGFYEGRNDTDTERLHTLVRTDTHIPYLKMIFSCNLQTIWFTARQDLPYGGMPVYWVDEYGKQHEGSTLDKNDPLQKRLFIPVPNHLFERWTEPLSASLNLKMTKEIGKRLKVSFYVNNLITYDPIYESNLKTTHQAWRTPFFGSEIRLRL